jgi:DNA (cytosine-5)-methyltransferase 1
MESTPHYSIDEFDNKEFQKTIPSSDLVNSKAVLTHYLHNINNGVSKHYKKRAVEVIKKYIKYKNDNLYSTKVQEVAIQKLLFEVENVPFPTPDNYSFKFIDLFAGIGGFRIALQNLGGKCVFSSEWDPDAQKTYRANFGEVPFGDITSRDTKNAIPSDFDILCGGFPCQAFSIAGYQKGFSDTRGTLFFDIEQILLEHRPKVVFLENVKNLVSHDNGRTFKIIIEVLEKKLGYTVYFKVLNSMTHANVPQNRERIFIVAFDPKRVKGHDLFKFPNSINLKKSIHDVLEKERQPDNFYYHKDHKYYDELASAMTKKNTVYQWRRVYVRENKSNVCPTLTANMGAGGHNVPLIKDDFGIRKLTPLECFAFQGYPMDKYILPPIANSKLYMQAGNSVTTNLIQRICSEILEVI